MRPPCFQLSRSSPALCALIVLAPLAWTNTALGAPTPQRSRPPVSALGTLAQLQGAHGCVVARSKPAGGCTPVRALRGPAPFLGSNAVAISPDDDDVYVTSLLNNSVTTFTRTPATGQLAQQTGTSACVIYVLAVGCSLGRALSAPEGLTVSPDGASVYATAFRSGAVDVFNRNSGSGALIQKSRSAGCVVSGSAPDCTRGRALLGASSVAVSPDGRYVYSAAFSSNAVSVFKRVTRAMTRGNG